MKFEYYCSVDFDQYLVALLESQKIKYETCALTNTIHFKIYSNLERCEEILTYINKLSYHLISKSSVFSKQEMDSASWYLFYVSRMGIETKNVDYTYDAKCPYTTVHGMHRHRHLNQINPFVSSKTIKWKNRDNFCSVETGFMTQIFCSNYAKDAIIKNGIVGVEFMPVLKGDLKTVNPCVSQLVFKHKLPLEAYTFIGKYSEDVCPFCGRINYIFDELNCDNIRLNTDKIPSGIDAFGSEITIHEGFGEEPIVISKKFYNLLLKGLNENPKHFIFYPIAY